MPSFPSTSALAFDFAKRYSVEDGYCAVLKEAEIDFHPAIIVPLNTFQLEHVRTLVQARADTETVWLTLAVVDKEGTVSQFVLQVKANTLGAKVSGRRDGSVGLGAWVNLKIHPPAEQLHAAEAREVAPEVAPPGPRQVALVSDHDIDLIADSVMVNHFTQQDVGVTRDDVTDALDVFHKKKAQLGTKMKDQKMVQVGLQDVSAPKRQKIAQTAIGSSPGAAARTSSS